MPSHGKIFKDTTLFLLLSALTNIFNFGRNFAVAKLLGPYLTGLCMSLLLVPQTLAYLNLGLPSALTFLIPYYKSKNDFTRAEEIKNKIFSFTTITALLVFIGIIVFIFIFRPQGLKTYLAYTAIFAFLGQYVRYFMANYASEKNFIKLGVTEFLYTTLLLTTSILLIIPYRVHGFWLSMIISIIAVALYCLYDYRKTEHLTFIKFTPQEILSLSSTGITMSLAAVIYVPFINLSKLFLTITEGVESVGYFVLSISVISLIAIIPKTISRVFMPHMSSLRGLNSEPKLIRSVFLKMQSYTFALTCFISFMGYILMEPLVKILLPQYLEGVAAAKIILIAGLPYSLIDNANSMLVAIHNKKILLKILVASLLVNVIIYLLLLIYGVTINRVSATLAVVFLFYASLLHIHILRTVK